MKAGSDSRERQKVVEYGAVASLGVAWPAMLDQVGIVMQRILVSYWYRCRKFRSDDLIVDSKRSTQCGRREPVKAIRLPKDPSLSLLDRIGHLSLLWVLLVKLELDTYAHTQAAKFPNGTAW